MAGIFNAKIVAQVNFTDLKLLEDRVKKLENKKIKLSFDTSDIGQTFKELNVLKNQKFKVDMAVTGDRAVVSALANIASQSNKVSRQASGYIATNIDEGINKAVKDVSKLENSFKDLSLQTKNVQMLSSLKKYSDSNQNHWLKEARTAQAEYQHILAQMMSPEFDPWKDIKKSQEMFKELELQYKRFSNAQKTMNMDLASDQQRLTKANAIEKFMLQNTKATKEAKAQLQGYVTSLRDTGNAMSKAQLNEIDIGFKGVENELIATDRIGKSLVDRFKNIGQAFVAWGAAAVSVQSITFAMKQLVSEAIKVDSAITELRKVSDASDNQLAQYFDEASKSAQKFGVLVSDVISSAADWSRLGYSLKDAEKLADTTTLLQRVGDNMTQESSSSGLISTLRGFGKEAEEAERIVDIVNEVANNEPIDTAGIFEGLSRSASSMAAANNTLEETIGIITAINSVVQDPVSIGTGLKTNLCLYVQKCA